MNRGNRTVAAISVLVLLAGCVGPQEEARAPREHRHASPAPVEAPTLPPGSFDRAKAAAELTQARAARDEGDPAAARRAAEAAVDHWPGNPAAWVELQTDCQVLNDTTCENQAAFFRAKVEFVSTLPARAAQLGFQNIAEEEPGTVVGNITLDQASLDKARRLWAFYATQDPMTAKLEVPPDEETFMQRNPYVPMLLVAGVVGGVLTGVKSLANR
jgi:hypothetical protein